MISVDSAVLNPGVGSLESCSEPELNGVKKSWVLRGIEFVARSGSLLLGIGSVILLLAVVANVPILQILSFGYLLEVTGRLARRRPLRDSFVGLEKAARIGAVVLGAWLILLPIRLLSRIWLDAYIIDPTSSQQASMRTLQFVLIVLALGHIFCAIVCGGKLRYFFWPIVAPFSFGVWFVRRFAGSRLFRRTLDLTVGLLSPNLVHEICHAKPVGDWFLPAIVWKKLRSGVLFDEARDGLWNFILKLRLGYYAIFGLKGFLGSVLWLLLPTWLLVVSTSANGPRAVLSGLIGGLIAVPVFSLLPFLQAHFSVDGRLIRFTEWRVVLRNMGRAPFAHFLALMLTLVLALPLFLFKVERIPTDLMWTLSIVFIVFTWPAKWITGWAYRRGAMGERPRRWWVRYPVWTLLLTISFVFVFLMFFTRYITWNGAASLLENHVFLLPSPFWLFGE